MNNLSIEEKLRKTEEAIQELIDNEERSQKWLVLFIGVFLFAIVLYFLFR